MTTLAITTSAIFVARVHQTGRGNLASTYPAADTPDSPLCYLAWKMKEAATIFHQIARKCQIYNSEPLPSLAALLAFWNKQYDCTWDLHSECSTGCNSSGMTFSLPSKFEAAKYLPDF